MLRSHKVRYLLCIWLLTMFTGQMTSISLRAKQTRWQEKRVQRVEGVDRTNFGPLAETKENSSSRNIVLTYLYTIF